MKYLVVGAGGTGGMIAAALKLSRNDVSLVARGNHLKKIQTDGLHVKSKLFGDKILKIPSFSFEEYDERPDVIFVCVKFYSLMDIIDDLKRVSTKDTIIIPILNVYGTGEIIQKYMPDKTVLDGCIYIVSFIEDFGVISHTIKRFQLFFGARKNQKVDKFKLLQIENDLKNSQIEAVNSDFIERDTFAKLTLISPYASCGAFYNVTLGEMQKNGVIRDTLVGLLQDLEKIAGKLQLNLGFNIIKRNLEIIDKMSPDTISSLLRDIRNNKKSEIDGQIFEVVRLAERLNVKVPTYLKVAQKLGYEG